MLHDMQVINYARPLHQKLLRIWRRTAKRGRLGKLGVRTHNDISMTLMSDRRIPDDFRGKVLGELISSGYTPSQLGIRPGRRLSGY